MLQLEWYFSLPSRKRRRKNQVRVAASCDEIDLEGKQITSFVEYVTLMIQVFCKETSISPEVFSLREICCSF
jgi:hypothetical protein